MAKGLIATVILLAFIPGLAMIVLGFNWTKMYDLTSTSNWKGPSWGSKLLMDVEMMKFWNEPEVAVSALKEFKVDAAKLAQMQNSGMHPSRLQAFSDRTFSLHFLDIKNR